MRPFHHGRMDYGKQAHEMSWLLSGSFSFLQQVFLPIVSRMRRKERNST